MDGEQALSSALLRIRRRHPFFATLAMFAQYAFDGSIATAATDGKTIALNPTFFAALEREQQAGLVLHELLHAALQHVPRRGGRDALLWNIAADIVVNGIIRESRHFSLPAGALHDDRLAKFSVEEIYEHLRTGAIVIALSPEFLADLTQAGCFSSGASNNADDAGYWEGAWHRAETLWRMRESGQGRLPVGLARAWQSQQDARVDWRTVLWQFVAHTPCDFQGFDRRHIHRGYYLDAMQHEALRVSVCVDTSGSITHAELDLFAAEIDAIRASYPHIETTLYFADATLYGPYALDARSELPPAEGAGGTSFIPFFRRVNEDAEQGQCDLAIYLTDGKGSFPVQPPSVPALWAICSGGLPNSAFPFGETLRLFNDSQESHA